MEVILLERISRLGQMGDTVRVKDGFARNFLLPQGKALRANEANKKKFEEQRVQLEARNLERKSEAGKIAEKLDGMSFVAVRSAGAYGFVMSSNYNTRPRPPEVMVDGANFYLVRPREELQFVTADI